MSLKTERRRRKRGEHLSLCLKEGPLFRFILRWFIFDLWIYSSLESAQGSVLELKY